MTRGPYEICRIILHPRNLPLCVVAAFFHKIQTSLLNTPTDWLTGWPPILSYSCRGSSKRGDNNKGELPYKPHFPNEKLFPFRFRQPKPTAYKQKHKKKGLKRVKLLICLFQSPTLSSLGQQGALTKQLIPSMDDKEGNS